MFYFFKKAFLDKTIKTTPSWNYFFRGLCVGQWGIGIIWRRRRTATECDESQMQQRANNFVRESE